MAAFCCWLITLVHAWCGDTINFVSTFATEIGCKLHWNVYCNGSNTDPPKTPLHITMTAVFFLL